MSTTLEILAKYQLCYFDPWTTCGFPDDVYPGETTSPGTVPDHIQEAKVRFKAVYARRNACVRRMVRLADRDSARLPLVEQIAFLTEAIDHLEDVYAPIGFVAEPVMDETMFTRELVFTHPRSGSAVAEPYESSFSLYIPIPLGDSEKEEGPNAS